VREPGQRVPVSLGKRAEGPNEIFEGYPALYMDVIGNVAGIIVINKVEMDYLIEYSKSG